MKHRLCVTVCGAVLSHTSPSMETVEKNVYLIEAFPEVPADGDAAAACLP